MSNTESIDKKVSEDTTEADLEAILKGLKQEQLDKLTKEKMKKSNRIKGLADNIYLENRKAPFHFDTIKEYNEYDLMCHKNAMTEAIRRIVAEDMAKDE